MIETLRVFRRWLRRAQLDPADFDVILVVKDTVVKYEFEAALKAGLPPMEFVVVPPRADGEMTLEGTDIRIVTRDEVRPPANAQYRVDAFQGVIEALKAAGYEVRSPRDNGYYQREME